jgi:3-mercaptopyruvate sulfurtransferase SseA
MHGCPPVDRAGLVSGSDVFARDRDRFPGTVPAPRPALEEGGHIRGNGLGSILGRRAVAQKIGALRYRDKRQNDRLQSSQLRTSPTAGD